MKRLLTSALALSLLCGTAAMAQPDYRADHRNDQGGYNQDRERGYHRDDNGSQRDNGHHWGRGERMPRDYYSDRSRYVDYRTYHLRRPPHGYQWVRTDDNNYALVALTTGLIASIIAANR